MAALHVQAGKISNREGQHDLNARFSTQGVKPWF
jgi:hypothetical protein